MPTKSRESIDKFKQAAEQVPLPLPPIEGQGVGARILSSVAGLRPEFRRERVDPIIEEARNRPMLERALGEQGRIESIANAQTGAGLEQEQERLGIAGERVGLERERLALSQNEEARILEDRRDKREAAQSFVNATFDDAGEFIFPDIEPTSEALRGMGPEGAAQAGVLEAMFQRASILASQRGEIDSVEDAMAFKGLLDKLDAELQQGITMLELQSQRKHELSRDQTRLQASRDTGIPDRVKSELAAFNSLRIQAEDALAFMNDPANSSGIDIGGFTVGLGKPGGLIEGNLPDAISRQSTLDLNTKLGDLASSFGNLRGGKNITATELSLFGSIIPMIQKNPRANEAALRQIISFIDVRTQEIFRAFGQVGIPEDFESWTPQQLAAAGITPLSSAADLQKFGPAPEGTSVIETAPGGIETPSATSSDQAQQQRADEFLRKQGKGRSGVGLVGAAKGGFGLGGALSNIGKALEGKR